MVESSSSLKINKSPGWQFKYLHIASNVEKRIPLTFPCLSIDMFCSVIPIAEARSFDLILRSANKTSNLTIIDMM
ncbi:hypothetical protein ETAE_0805 [Edwardsiella piscicida]|uniref:Uncharacterized protein n=1 Tax=Edwardsiella piscicida TaxID=1263550 RepID=A0AAU8P1P3_EDWPI|nr:hypothetical protein ETAE_0805 [Edwardsiella tarda EIB202]